MKITGEIRLREESVLGPSGANVRLKALWVGGKLARLTKEAINYDALYGYKVCRRLDRSTILLFQTRLRVIAEYEDCLVVMKETWKAVVIQIGVRILERILRRRIV